MRRLPAVILAISILFSGACSASPEASAATSHVSTAVFESAVATALEATSKAVSTPTLTPSPTRTQTPSPTPPPTLPPALAQARLLLADLPQGFEEVDPAEFGLPLQNPSDEGPVLAPPSVFIQGSTHHLVIVYPQYLNTSTDRAKFDLQFGSSQALIETVSSTFPPGIIEESFPLSASADLGDARSGASLILPPSGDSPRSRMDAIAFRRGAIGVQINVFYPLGAPIAISVQNIAEAVDIRLQALP